ncbi:MAG: histidine phosphatase family protein [bacterium]|nr:histidine phosphatase family protein [bacterium]
MVVRHGRTEWNASRRFQGHSDIPLSAEGRAQARALGDALRGRTFARAYASDLGRALETARAIAEPHGLAVVPDARLREFNFGKWEGLTWNEIVERWPELRDHGSTAAKLYVPEGGESFAVVCDRVRAFFDEVATDGEETILVVTHAGVLHATLEVFGHAIRDRRGDPMSLNFSPASITELALDADGVRIITLNHVAHLDSIA